MVARDPSRLQADRNDSDQADKSLRWAHNNYVVLLEILFPD